MPQITKQLAEVLCKKLGAVETTSKNSVHDIFAVYHNGRIVGTIGIRRSPRKDQGHGHVPDQLFVRKRFAYEMAVCRWNRDDYLREIGELPQLETRETEEPLAAELPEEIPGSSEEEQGETG